MNLYASPKKSSNRAHQLLERKGLGDDGIGPRGGGGADLGRPGEEGDPDPGPAGPDLLHELTAVVGADVDVEEDRPDVVLAQVTPCLVERVGLEHSVALELEVDLAEKPDRTLVVDDEHGVAAPHGLGV